MKKPYKILLAEDEPNLRMIYAGLLEDAGFQCIQAEDGQAAKEILEKQEFDLLISDFRMPRMNGAELLEWCRASNIHFPIIFITANVELLPKELVALDDCCAASLQKPFDVETLLSAIKDAQIRNHKFLC